MKDEKMKLKWLSRFNSSFILHPSSFLLLVSVFDYFVNQAVFLGLHG